MFNNDGSVAGTFRRDGMFKDPKGNEQFQVLADGRIIDPKTGHQIGTLTEDGRLLDVNGNEISDMRVLRDADGNLIGIIDDEGNIIDTDGIVIGRILPDGTIVDKNGNIIGKINPDGTVTLSEGGKNIKGRLIPKGEYTVKDGKVYDKDGKLLGTLGADGKIRDANGDIVGWVNPDGSVTMLPKGYKIKNGNELYDADGILFGNVAENGNIYDKNGNLIGRVNPDGSITLFGKKGPDLGTVTGDLSLIAPDLGKAEAMTGESGSATGSGRRIFLNGKLFDVTPQGSLVDKDGNIIGYMGEDGRPYSLDERPLSGKDSPMARPDTKKPTVVHPDQREAMDGLLASRRAAMKSKIRSFERMLPDARTLARARKKEDPDWGEPKIVSTYPVDMSRMILKDKAIPAVLVHSIDSRYADVPVTAIVERHIYAESGRRIIIPAGSRLIGTGGSGGGGGQHVNKMTFTRTRLIRPDGSAFSFSANSGDAQGRGGVPAYLDEQLLKKYGRPVLQSTLTSAIAFITATNEDITTKENGDQVQSARAQAANDARTNFIDSMSQIFQQLLNEAVNVEDVVFVPAGTRLTVYSNSDLWLRSEAEDEEDYLNAFGADTKQAKGSSKGNWSAARSSEMSELAAEKGITAEVGESAIYADEDYYDPVYNDGAGMNSAGQMAPIYDGAAGSEPAEASEPTPKETPKKSGAGSVQPIFPKQQQVNSRSRLF